MEKIFLQQQLVINKLLKLSLHSTQIENILQEALEIIVQTPWLPLHAKGGIFLTDPQNEDQLKLISTTNFSKPLLTLCSTIPFGHCLCGRAATSKKIVFAGEVDHRHDIQFDQMKPHGHYNVPILDSQQKVLGVMVLYVDHGHKKQQYEISFLEDISNTLAGMIIRSKQDQKMGTLQQKTALMALITTYNHEFNTPLAIAQGMKDRLLKTLPENKELHKLGEALERIHKIVKKIEKVPYEELNFRDYSGAINQLITLPVLTSSEVSLYISSLDQVALISVTDRNGIITYINDQFCKFYGYNKNELIGQNHHIVNSGHHSKEFFHDFWETINSGKIWIGDVKNKKKDGTYYWASSTVTPIYSQEGDITGFLSIKYDNTARKLKEERMLANRQLRLINQIFNMKQNSGENFNIDEEEQQVLMEEVIQKVCHQCKVPITFLKDEERLLVNIKKDTFVVGLKILFEFIFSSCKAMKKDIQQVQIKATRINKKYLISIETPLPKLTISQRRSLLEGVGIIKIADIEVPGLNVPSLIFKSHGGDLSFNDIKEELAFVIQLSQ